MRVWSKDTPLPVAIATEAVHGFVIEWRRPAIRGKQEHEYLATTILVQRVPGWMIEPGQTAGVPENLPPHPRLLFNRNELPRIKQRIRGESEAYFESLRSQADGWLKREVKLPDRGGQWFHWYSCPKHGARLRTEGPNSPPLPGRPGTV